jgi:uncharacterized glyoxalase superfamily protein PhnB
MSQSRPIAALGATLVALLSAPTNHHERPAMSVAAPESTSRVIPKLVHLAPVLIVDDVEAGVAFWVDRFGFTASNQVPGPDGKLAFASVAKDGVELMYQSKASVLADHPDKPADLEGRSVALFITVADLDVVERAVVGAPVVKARHRTFYGSTELYVKEPGGNTVGFAQF